MVTNTNIFPPSLPYSPSPQGPCFPFLSHAASPTTHPAPSRKKEPGKAAERCAAGTRSTPRPRLLFDSPQALQTSSGCPHPKLFLPDHPASWAVSLIQARAQVSHGFPPARSSPSQTLTFPSGEPSAPSSGRPQPPGPPTLVLPSLHPLF